MVMPAALRTDLVSVRAGMEETRCGLRAAGCGALLGLRGLLSSIRRRDTYGRHRAPRGALAQSAAEL